MNMQLTRSLLFICVSLTAACGGGGGGNPPGDGGNGGGNGGGVNPPDTNGSKGLVFVAQTPHPDGTSDIGSHTATFGNGQPDIGAAVRGGSLYFLRRDGTLEDILDAALKNGCAAGAGALCDENGSHHVDADGLLVSGYVVRRPRVHWDADRILFSMVSGAILEQHGNVEPAGPRWQLYELSGLDPEDTPLVTRVAGQPEEFNNVDGVYGSDDTIFFISDRTVTGNPDHYPQLDEYESLPINTGLWKLDRDSGKVTLMDHSPSGDFGPEITPSGQLIFTRWDHLQQDQQSIDNSVASVITDREDFWNAYTYGDENDAGEAEYALVSTFVRGKLQEWVDTGKADDNLLREAAAGMEIYPETVRGNPFYDWDGKAGEVAGTFEDALGTEHDIVYSVPATEYGQYNYLRFNHFLPWQIRQDGTQCETYRHTGLHENGGFIQRALLDDPRLRNVDVTRVTVRDGFFLNQVHDEEDTGREIVTGVVAPEFGTHKAGRILLFVDNKVEVKPALHEDGDAVDYAFLTDPVNDEHLYRDPLFLSDGRLVAAVSSDPGADHRDFDAFDFRLHVMELNEDTGFHEPGAALLPEAIAREFDYWEENGGIGLREFSGSLWEIELQEVIARTPPAIPPAPALDDPELDAFTAAGVSAAAFEQYLRDNKLAAIVIRNATTRDQADVTQPFNLVVRTPDGNEHEQTVHTDFEELTDTLYPITYLQLMRGDYLRGYQKLDSGAGGSFRDNGRRILPKELAMTGELAHNLDVAADALPGSVPVAEDGSIAALVPARRALTWQLTDDDGDPVVRERYWLTFQPGEVRVCASCHGINDIGQDGNGKPVNSPQALRLLLEELKDAGKL